MDRIVKLGEGVRGMDPMTRSVVSSYAQWEALDLDRSAVGGEWITVSPANVRLRKLDPAARFALRPYPSPHRRRHLPSDPLATSSTSNCVCTAQPFR